MDKFLLAKNPMRTGSGVFIVHLLDPIAIIECHEGNIPEKAGRIDKVFSFRNADSLLEFWTLSIFHPETRDPQAISLLDRAWRWYRAYLEWAGKNLNPGA